MRVTAGYTRLKPRIIRGEDGKPKTIIVEDHTPDARHPIELNVPPPANDRMEKRFSIVLSGLHYLEFRRNWWIEHIGMHLSKIKNEAVLEEVLTVASKVESEMRSGVQKAQNPPVRGLENDMTFTHAQWKT